ncbi:MAG: M14 family murein peptide amidase A [Gammaproteobacteria bacterium]|nr:M14 family murein peptide amidase A [Gammaproteobacteria bacterium]
MMRITAAIFWFLLSSLMSVYAANDETNNLEQDICKLIAGKLGSVSLADCQEMDLQLTGATSVNNIPIVQKEYPPLNSRKPQAKVLVLGGIHGDEYSSVSIVFKWMKKLNQYHSGLFHWRVVPLLNPDGLLRKKSQRMNANGVDLNRNFPTPNWEKESNHYWIERTSRNPRRYPGRAPLSEPESRWFAQEIESFKPDVIVSVHAPHGILDFDGPPKPPARFGQLYLRLLGTYPGSLGNYAGVHKRIPVVTIELPRAGIMPTTSEVSRIWVDLIRWMRGNLPKKIEQTPVQVSRDDQAGPS